MYIPKLQTDLYGIRVMAQARKHYQKNYNKHATSTRTTQRIFI